MFFSSRLWRPLTSIDVNPICCFFIAVLGPGSGFIGFGTRFYAKLTYRELGSSHERPIQGIFHVKMRDAISRNIIDRQNIFSKREFTTNFHSGLIIVDLCFDQTPGSDTQKRNTPEHVCVSHTWAWCKRTRSKTTGIRVTVKVLIFCI